MAYSTTQIGIFLAAVAALTAIALLGFGVPLGTLLIIGLLLCCPVMMLGMHGGAHKHEGQSSAAAVSEAEGSAGLAVDAENASHGRRP